jgi:hypothetical protein
VLLQPLLLGVGEPFALDPPRSTTFVNPLSTHAKTPAAPGTMPVPARDRLGRDGDGVTDSASLADGPVAQSVAAAHRRIAPILTSWGQDICCPESGHNQCRRLSGVRASTSHRGRSPVERCAAVACARLSGGWGTNTPWRLPTFRRVPGGRVQSMTNVKAGSEARVLRNTTFDRCEPRVAGPHCPSGPRMDSDRSGRARCRVKHPMRVFGPRDPVHRRVRIPRADLLICGDGCWCSRRSHRTTSRPSGEFRRMIP